MYLYAPKLLLFWLICLCDYMVLIIVGVLLAVFAFAWIVDLVCGWCGIWLVGYLIWLLAIRVVCVVGLLVNLVRRLCCCLVDLCVWWIWDCDCLTCCFVC